MLTQVFKDGYSLIYFVSLQAGTVVGFFNGLHIELEDTLKNPELEMTPYKVWNDWDDKEALLTLPIGKLRSQNMFGFSQIE